MDESGDLGSGRPGSSKKLLVCLVCTKQRKKLNKIIRKTKQRLLEKKKTGYWLNKKGGEIKFYSFPNKNILTKALKEISKVDFKVYYVCFNKQNKKIDNKSKENILVYLFWHIFEKSKKLPEKIISDLSFFDIKVNRPSYFLLTEYQKEKIRELGKDGTKFSNLKNHIKFEVISPEKYKQEKEDKDKFPIKVEPLNSRHYDELQAIDLICGSIFQNLENNNSQYFDIIKDKIELGEEIN